MKNRRHDNTLVLGAGKTSAWTPHDLRRTGATMMQGLGVSLELIDRCQNHVLPGSKVRRHYMLHDYAEEKQGAWAALGERLAALAWPWTALRHRRRQGRVGAQHGGRGHGAAQRYMLNGIDRHQQDWLQFRWKINKLTIQLRWSIF